MAKKPCFHFQIGRCTKGDRCDYAHVPDPNFQRKPCHHFQLGRCNKGDDCGYAHVRDPNFVRPPCHAYMAGRCNKGAACNFSHDLGGAVASSSGQVNGDGDAAASSNTRENGNTEAGKASTEATFREWRYLIPHNLKNVRKLGHGMGKFWKLACALTSSGEPGVTQEVIEMLAGEAGMTRITELLDQPFDDLTEAQAARIFDAHLLPFFMTLANENISSSAILEGRLTIICNFVYGPHGQRAALLFQAVTRHLSTLSLLSPEEGVDDSVASAFEHSLAALAMVVKSNTAAHVHEGLLAIVETMSALLDQANIEATVFALGKINKHMSELQHRFGIGKSVPTTNGKPKANGSRPTFELAKEAPGPLSPEGPRHDNDHDDIRMISILPTVQEICSSRNEYLPTADSSEWHMGGLEGLLDRQFRLLREDTVGQLRDAAKFELERLQDPRRHAGNQMKRQGARTFVYKNVGVEDIAFDPHGGFEFALGFDQPAHLANKSDRQRRDWWEGSKRMGVEALVCLLSSEGSANFFTIAPEPGQAFIKDAELKVARGQLHKNFNLHRDAQRAFVIARLVSVDDARDVIDKLLTNNTAEIFSLVEFPGVILPSFMPTLKAMQDRSESLDIPFADILAPTSTPDNPDREVDIKLPAYATKPGFRFDLKSLTTDNTALHLTPRQQVEETARRLEAHSMLDAGQAEALISSLSRRFAMIQGPPGTGKSYSGVQITKALLANKDQIDLGPILSVTFTNHAQDQGLLRLVDEGVTQIVRIGGRSKAERLAEVNLRIIASKQELTKTEKKDKYNYMKKTEHEAKEINRFLGALGHVGDQAQLEAYLQVRNSDHYEQLFSGFDEEGFQLVRHHNDNVIGNWLRSGPYIHAPPREMAGLEEIHVNAMTSSERRLLHTDWLNEIRQELLDRLATALDGYKAAKEKLDLIRTETDLRVLKQASIIGCTTSGLARNLDLLRRLKVKVLLCEEAGELLEAHLLTALLPSVEHVIQIGDHRQLRPHVQNYELSAESRGGSQYALDVSLFERLVEPRNILTQPMPFSTLEVQRRMHPAISSLIRKTIYPNLKDAPSTLDHPEVSGMKHRLFWLHHEKLENEGGDQQSTSHTNDFEVQMVSALLSHLVKQGCYKPEDIAILTPYLGQLRQLRNKLSSSYEIVVSDRDEIDLMKEGAEGSDADADGQPAPAPRNQVAKGSLLSALRLATIDNFQGEEAKVVVVSLVRSNKSDKPGFLKTSNRINVLLSRAQHGMYIVGNSNTMKNVPMWANVVDMFKADNLLGTSLDLTCPRHPDTPLLVSSPDDFVRLSPEGGCQQMCEARLSCGHACSSPCHSDLLHEAVFCLEDCSRPKAGCSHVCRRRCGEECAPRCLETVSGINVTPPGCDHVKTSLPCWEFQHPAEIECLVPVVRTVEGCGHEIEVACFEDTEASNFRCTAVCGELRECSHACSRRCCDCRIRTMNEDGGITENVDHGRCKSQCGRAYTSCRHYDTSACHGSEPCPPCHARCDSSCAHSRCTRKCSEPCPPCAEEDCDIEFCKNAGCCSAPCVFVPNSHRCEMLLACGCQCPSVTGERCPGTEFCQKCGLPENLAQTADYIGGDNYADVDLDESPCIFTACGHVFTIETLDGWMSMKTHYEIDEATGEYLSLKHSAEPFSSDELKLCPACRGPLRDIARYGRIVRRAMLDESAKKFTAWSGRRHLELSEKLVAEQDVLLNGIDSIRKPIQDVQMVGSVTDQLKAVKQLKTTGRYRQILHVRNEIDAFTDKLRREEQPFQRVRDLVELARRRNQQAGIPEFEFHSSELQLREHLQGISLLVRAEIMVLLDVMNVHNKTPESADKGILRVDFSENRKCCDALIQYAKDTVSVRQQAEGHIFWAQYAAMECGTLDYALQQEVADPNDHLESLKALAFGHLEDAEMVLQKLPEGNEDLQNEIGEVKRMLDSGTSESEMRMVVGVMAKEFGSATGHWYRCVNGHPYTVGECGRPMQLSRCPWCGAGVGGQQHVSTTGVTEARDLEERFGGMTL